MENTLKASLITAIEAGILAQTGQAPTAPNLISGLSAGIANAAIPFLTANLLVTVTGAVTTGVGAGGVVTGTGVAS